MIKKALFIIFVLSQSAGILFAQFRATSQGILVNAGSEQVELAVAKKAAFRISVHHSPESASIPSVFIDPDDNTHAGFTVISKAPEFGIKTSYGSLIINSETKIWMLYDAKGKLLIPDGSLLITDSLQSISFAYPNSAMFYGSGNYSTKNLVKTKSVSRLGNGTADLPYLWSNSGYSAMGITENDNKPATWSRLENSRVKWNFQGKSADLYIWPAKNLYDATSVLMQLTGKPKLPPKWAFGYLQSQWGWADRAYIEDVLNHFRTRNLPVDAFIYDFEWYTVTPDYSIGKNGQANFSDFSFNPKLFPEPSKQISDYKSQGVKFIGIRKPRLANDSAVSMARKNGWLIRPESNSRDLNFSIDTLRKWYAVQNKPLLNAGVDAWWDDEGESYYTCYYWWNKAQYDLRSSARPNDRHFTINRSFSPGNQRWGYSTWNGDIKSTWDALLKTPADLLNWSLSGMVYGTCDIGGFQGTPTKENLVRWFEAGVFLPVMRAHSDIMTKPHFPWLWDTDGEEAIRKALNLRYQLIPYLYSLGHESYRNGTPMMRPLVMEFPNDTAVSNLTDEWLVGKGLLAAPVLNQGGNRYIYLPDDLWYDFNTNKPIHGPVAFSVNKQLDEIPVFVRAGTILPLGPVIQHTEQDTAGSLEIRIYPGHDGVFTLTEDDGKSYNYTKGDVLTTTFTWKDAAKKLTWKVNGSYDDKKVYRNITCVFGDQTKKAVLGKKGKIKFSR